MSCCNKIAEVFKKILKAIGPILAIILICVAIYFLVFAGPAAIALFEGFTFLPAFVTTMTISPTIIGFVALGAAVLISPETAEAVAAGVGKVVGRVAVVVVGAIAGGLSTGLFGTGGGQLLLLAGVGFGLWYFFGKKKTDDPEAADEPPSIDGGVNYGV